MIFRVMSCNEYPRANTKETAMLPNFLQLLIIPSFHKNLRVKLFLEYLCLVKNS